MVMNIFWAKPVLKIFSEAGGQCEHLFIVIFISYCRPDQGAEWAAVGPWAVDCSLLIQIDLNFKTFFTTNFFVLFFLQINKRKNQKINTKMKENEIRYAH